MDGDQAKLSNKVIRGGTWLFGLRISQRLLSVVRLLILARLLAPRDFGQLGVALAVLTTLEIFSTTGFDAALIYKKEDVEEYFNSAWTVSILRGILIFLVLYLIAPVMAIYFEEPGLAEIIPVTGIAILFRSLNNVAIVNFSKHLNFQKLYVYHGAGALADFIVAVLIAIFYRSVWALVLGLLAGDLVRLVLSYVLVPYRPRLEFNLVRCRELFSYGKWIFRSNYIVFFLTQGKDLYVAKVLGASLLGFYQMAYKISNMTTSEISHVICQVTFPAYAQIHDDPERLRSSFAKVLKVKALITFPVSCLILVLAPEFTQIFLGDKWLEIVPALQVLCVHGVVNSYNSILGSVFQGMGRPNIIAHGSVLQLLLLLVIIHPLSVKFGIVGTALAITVSSLLMLLYLSKRLSEFLHFNLIDYYRSMSVQFSACVLMLFFLAVFMGQGHTGLLGVFLAVMFGAAFYVVAVMILDKGLKMGLCDIVREVLPQRG